LKSLRDRGRWPTYEVEGAVLPDVPHQLVQLAALVAVLSALAELIKVPRLAG
jgi:hypothetical protein